MFIVLRTLKEQICISMTGLPPGSQFEPEAKTRRAVLHRPGMGFRSASGFVPLVVAIILIGFGGDAIAQGLPVARFEFSTISSPKVGYVPFRVIITAKAVDVLQCDTVLSGGISEGRKIAGMASAFHIQVSPHGDPHMAVHLLASLPNALIMETYPAVESQYNLALPLFPVKDGYIEVPRKPGLGIDPDPQMVKKYRVS